MTTHTVYIDLVGDDAEHADRLADIVGRLATGFGLSLSGDGTPWHGGSSYYTIDEGGNAVRIGATFPGPGSSRTFANRATAYLLANLWHDVLVRVFVVDGDGDLWHTAHGTAASYVEAVEALEAAPRPDCTDCTRCTDCGRCQEHGRPCKGLTTDHHHPSRKNDR